MSADLARQSQLLAWFGAHARAMPWRSLDAPADPYKVVVSELMLQQTRVDTVRDYFARWVARWPDWTALADAHLDDVLGQWTGLGYYNRARNLHRLAQTVARDHGGRLPADVAVLRALPGIGPYTAGAVASIAFAMPVSLVDGNVARVLARWTALRDDPTAGAGKQAVWRLAELELTALGPARVAPGHWNQALMELGATVCTPRAPACGSCPVTAACPARALGLQAAIPPVKVRAPVVVVAASYAVVRDRAGRVLLGQRPARGRWAGLWEPPGAEGSQAGTALRQWADRNGIALGPPLPQLVHVLTHRRYEATPLPARSALAAIEVTSLGYVSARWVTVDQALAATGGLSRLGQRLLIAAGGV